jgi:hypothetical protein
MAVGLVVDFGEGHGSLPDIACLAADNASGAKTIKAAGATGSLVISVLTPSSSPGLTR